MSRCLDWTAAALLLCVGGSTWAMDDYPGVGREATATEVRAWDIDVRADFKGLPPGAGSVIRGRGLYQAQCASCHGSKGESNAFSVPLVGGTTPNDRQAGRVHALAHPVSTGPTTFMLLPNLSSLFDYIQRAMPWDAPKSLPPDDVYAVTAYLLYLAEIVPEDFTLSQQNVAEIQGKLPNRHGMTTDHGFWPGADAASGGLGNGGVPDIRAELCMQDCTPNRGE